MAYRPGSPIGPQGLPVVRQAPYLEDFQRRLLDQAFARPGMPLGRPQGLPPGMPLGMPPGMPLEARQGLPQGLPLGAPPGMPQGPLPAAPMGLPQQRRPFPNQFTGLGQGNIPSGGLGTFGNAFSNTLQWPFGPR